MSANNITVHEDQVTSISCNATDVQKPKITWEFEGGELPSGVSFSTTEEGSVLQLRNATKGMEGVHWFRLCSALKEVAVLQHGTYLCQCSNCHEGLVTTRYNMFVCFSFFT